MFSRAVEVVLFVLGLPEAVGEFEFVEEGSVHADGGLFSLDFEFGDEGEFELASAGGEQVLEGAADRHFVVEV